MTPRELKALFAVTLALGALGMPARDRRGRRVKLFVDPQTARILRKVLICE